MRVDLHHRLVGPRAYFLGQLKLKCVFESLRFLLLLLFLKVWRRSLSRIILLSQVNIAVLDLNLLYFKGLQIIILFLLSTEGILGLLRGAI